jgi:AcrR family transcriptional regulator
MVKETPVRWRRRKKARPAEILAAALECFRERGFTGTRLEDVAARAGVTKGTIYLYYPSKEDLFKAVVRGELTPNIERLEAILEQPGPTTALLERLLTTWEMVVATPISIMPKLMIAEAGNFPDLARFYLENVVHRAMGLIAGVLRRGIERGEFRAVDVDHAVPCVVGPLLLTALWKHSLGQYDEKPMDVAGLCRAHLDLLLHGLETRGPASATRSSPERRRR